MKKVLLIIVLSGLVSCMGPIHVNYDYEKSTDFSTYKTYHFYKEINSGLSQLDEKRLVNAIDSVMQAKGYSLSETADFFININSDQFENNNRNAVGIGVGGTGGNVGGGVSVGIPVGRNTVTRQIQFDFIDENKQQLIWTATSESNFSPNASPTKRKEKFKAIVVKVLCEFPPDKK